MFENCSTKIEKTEEEILLNTESSFVAKSEFGEYKNETNNSIKENSASIELNANNIETANNELEYFKLQNNANISIQASAIISQIENLFSKKTDLEDFSESVSSQITQTSENISEIFSQRILLTDEKMLDLENNVLKIKDIYNSYAQGFPTQNPNQDEPNM